jgi:hypothetical protein
MTASSTKTGEVLAAARAELQAQLAVVRGELTRVAAEERALTQALSALGGGGRTTKGGPAARKQNAETSAPRRSSRSSTRRRRRKRGSSKPTEERIQELQALLADGPKSRNDLAAALQVSPPRIQQLLTELGTSVSSEPDPKRGQVKLWSLTGSSNGASGSSKPSARRKSRTKSAASK